MTTTLTVNNIENTDGGATISKPISVSARTLPFWKPLLAIAVVAGVFVIMWFAYAKWIMPKPLIIKTGYVPFAGLAVVTAALERLLEPLSDVLLPKDSPSPKSPKEKAAASLSTAQAAAANHDQQSGEVRSLLEDAAKKKAVVDARPVVRMMAFWAIASSVGLAISGGFGFLLLQGVTKNHVNTAFDLAVTGLAIGAGTKPLHDLITGIQSKRATQP